MPEGSAGKNMVLAVTGSIAAYKAASVVRGLMGRDHTVQVIMTEAARFFVTPTTFRALSGRPALYQLFPDEGSAGLTHIELGEWAELMAVVPATANILGKFAGGLADDLVSCTWMACDCPRVIAPAMNDRMWESPATQRNYNRLKEREDVTFVEPVGGKLASGKEATSGRLAPVEDIIEKIHSVAIQAGL